MIPDHNQKACVPTYRQQPLTSQLMEGSNVRTSNCSPALMPTTENYNFKETFEIFSFKNKQHN